MTTQAPERVTVETVPDIDPTSQTFKFGLADATFVVIQALDTLPENHPSAFAWDALMDDVLAEVGPDVAKLVDQAVRRRLPWTWEEK